MVRKFIPLWLGFCTCLPAGLWAEEATKKGLSSIPSDAVAFLYAPTVKSLDSAYQGLLRDLGLQIFLPPPARSITGLIGQNFPMFEGIDEEGTFALVLMPFERPEEFYSKLAFIVPAKDPDAMLKALGGQAGEGEQWAVNLMGQPAVALVDGKSLVISSSADVAKAIKQSKAGMGEKLPAAELAAFTDMNVALWINAEQIFKVYGTTIDPLVSMLLMQRQGAASALERSSAGMNKKTIDSFVAGLRSLNVGLGYPKGGLAVRATMTYKPGSDLAKELQLRSTSDPLLGGVPAGKYMLAFGQNLHAEQVKASLQNLDPFFQAALETDGIDKDKAKQLRSYLEEWALLATGLRGCVEVLSPGEAGLLGLSCIIETSNSKRWLELASRVVELSKKLVDAMPDDMVDDDLKPLTKAVTYNSEAEDIEGTKIGHLTFDVGKLGELDEEAIEEFLKIVGKEGALFRLGALDGKTVVLSFGGGSKGMSRLIGTAKKKEAPLESDPGIKNVASRLPQKRASVMYVAVDNIVQGIQAALKVVDEEPLPLHMSTLNAPLLVTTAGEEGRGQLDVFLPTKLLVAIKNAAMVLMGSMQGPAGQ